MTTFTSVTDNVSYPAAANINQYGTLFQEIPGPDGWMENGTLSVTVSSNNLTVALKTKAGANPSASDPVTVWINGTKRQCTAALSVTKNAGTNWFNAGGAELATKEVDYFVYLIWNTTPATDIMDIGIARIPYGRLYSDFSGTTTNEKYMAFGNASTPTSSNDVVNIGRFAATLSAGAGYTWTVPTFTNSNLINTPIFETRLLTWAPAWTNLSVGNGTVVANYKIRSTRAYATIGLTFGSTTSISGIVDSSYPFTRIQTNSPTLGQVVLTDFGTANYIGEVRYSSSTALRFWVRNASATYETLSTLSSTVPHTWANTDLIDTEFQYDIN